MRVECVFGNEHHLFEVKTPQAVIGRRQPGVEVDVDLAFDQAVSRRHARVWVENGECWVEDLGSRNGTRVGAQPITGPHRLKPGDEILVGISVLRVEAEDASPVSEVASGTVTATLPGATPVDAVSAGLTTRRLALVCGLPLEFGSETNLDTLLLTVVRRLIDAIPAARRAALLLGDAGSDRLLLKAHLPPGTPAVSLTLARQAMERREAFMWTAGEDVTTSQAQLRSLSAMYAPLVWKEQVLGAVCVDNDETAPEFTGEDLQILVAIAQYAALAVVHQQLEDDLRRNATVIGRLLTNFSPRVRDRLLAKAHQGRLRLGGERAEVTVLCSDIRGFTRLSAGMDAEDVVDMLNDYFGALVERIFALDGTVDKFVGDSILAVFGSPDADPAQYEKAVRAAVGMQEAMTGINARRRARGQVTCEIGIGVHCGEVLHGFIGSDERMEYTVIGDAVNIAARYCDGAKPNEVLISPAVHQRVWRLVDAEPLPIPTKHEGDLPALRVKGLRT